MKSHVRPSHLEENDEYGTNLGQHMARVSAGSRAPMYFVNTGMGNGLLVCMTGGYTGTVKIPERLMLPFPVGAATPTVVQPAGQAIPGE